jgi:cytochrome c553
MKRLAFAVLAAALLSAGLTADSNQPPRAQRSTPAPPLAASHNSPPLSIDAQNKLVAASCSTCHDDEAKTGGLSLQSFDAATINQHADVTEKMIRKLRAGMMPPPSVKDRPDQATLKSFA